MSGDKRTLNSADVTLICIKGRAIAVVYKEAEDLNLKGNTVKNMLLQKERFNYSSKV